MQAEFEKTQPTRSQATSLKLGFLRVLSSLFGKHFKLKKTTFVWFSNSQKHTFNILNTIKVCIDKEYFILLLLNEKCGFKTSGAL